MKKISRKSAEPVHWASLGERGVYLGLRLMLGTYRVLGRFGFSVLLMPVVLYFYLSSRQARGASRDYLARVYDMSEGEKSLGRQPDWRSGIWHFYEFGQSILDKIAAWVGDIKLEEIVFENSEVFDKLAREGRGAVLIGSHLGNMEVCRALSRRHRDLKLHVLVHTKHSENFNRVIQEASPDSGVSLIQTTDVGPGTAMLLKDGVDEGNLVVLVGDRTPQSGAGRNGWASFLGKDAPFPQGGYILAALFECPVVLIFCVKRGKRYHITFEPFAEQIELPRRNRDDALQSYVTKFAKRLEFHTLRAPFQWFNFFDFWNQAAGSAARDTQNSEGK
jgi:predicted LPLAT superfamily acyltransferase